MDKFDNVLIGEDDTDDFNFFVEAIKVVWSKSQITRGVSGLECITLLKKFNKPNIIFLNISMPVKSGVECLKFIKDTPHLSAIPVIIYSTSHYIKDIDACFKAGAFYYIVKPGNADLLVGILSKVFNAINNGIKTVSKEDFVVRAAVAINN